jgi:hypothetical protein
MFYADSNLFAQCKPILAGKHSLCSPPSNNRFDYTITNFSSSFTYSASVFLSTGALTTSPVTSATFTAFTYSPSITNARIIVTASNGTCVDADTIYVQACCEEFLIPELTDIPSTQIPGLVGNTYNPSVFPFPSATVVIHGQLEVTSGALEFVNTTILMDQGASILVRGGAQLYLNNSTIRHGRCNFMWEGINLENNAVLKTNGNTNINDAQYAVNILGNVGFHFSAFSGSTTSFQGNFISIYAGDNIGGNNNLYGTASSAGGIVINGAPPLLAYYYGQSPLPAGSSFAGIYLKDVANFNSRFSVSPMPITINNINIGIGSIRGSMTLDENVTINNVSPALNGSAQAYAFSSAYNGSAIYCEGTNTTPQSISFGRTNSSGINRINNCRYGVNAFRNVNVNCVNSDIDNVTNLGGVRVDNFNIGGRTINIVNNRFQQRFFCAVYLRRLNSANLVINGNTFNTGAYYQVNTNPSLGDLGNVAIRIAAVSPTTLTGSISNNVFTSSRIGIYASNIRGRSSDPNDLFKIKDNVMNMDRLLANYNVPGNPNSVWRHLGIWLENSRNLDVVENNIVRTNSLNGAPTGFEEYLIGIKVQNMMGASVLLRNNTITRCGTGIKFSGFCFGTSVYCNTITSDPLVTFPRGLFFDNAGLSNQGANCNPFGNTYAAFSSSGIAYKVSGVLSTRMEWFGPGSITPFSVGPTPFFIVVPTSCTPYPSICGEISNVALFAMYDRVHQIVYDEITYEENPEESRYLDLVFAYNAILNDSVLQTMDPVYLQFIDFHANDNIGQYVDANALRNNDQVVDALNRLNELINLNVIDQNRVTTERIALTLELENRELSDSERTVLTPIAESNYLIGGDGVINARALLDKEIPMGIGTEEVSYLRRKNPKVNNGTPQYTISEILKWSELEKEKVDVKVYNVIGKLVFENKLTEWLDKKSNLSIGIVNVSYYFNNQFVGVAKESLIK